MDKVVSYNEFLKHRNNIESYLNDLFDKVPELNVYFPNSLSSEERHLIYTKSKGYLFEKLHKIGSKYSIKLWKPVENGLNSVTEEKSEEEKSEEEKSEEEKSVSDEEEDYITDDEYEDDNLSSSLILLEKNQNIIFSEVQKCRRSVNRVECVFTSIVLFNLVGSVIFLMQAINLTTQLPRFNIITDF